MSSLNNVALYDPNIFETNTNHEQLIDYFFTQRKVTEYEEYIDQKDMLRKKKKSIRTYNWLALNLPTKFFDKVNLNNNFEIIIEIWGDKQHHFEGTFNRKKGIIPHILIKLNGDTQIFVKLKFKMNDTDKIFTNFIQIPKRYQINPENINI